MKTCFLAILSVLLLSNCSLFYVAKQGAYQLKLLAGAEPIEKVLRSPNLPLETRQKLTLITEIREYCQKKLHLKTNNYQNVNLSWHHIIYNVSASEALAFRPYTWWFPIIGSVPYKGFFDEKDADKEISNLKTHGFQTLKRQVGGYSTLGYFQDPVWPSMLKMSDAALVELIIHELTHATFYLSHQTPFNETLANFVGKTGTRMFFVDKFGEHSSKVEKLDNYYHDEKIYNDFFFNLYQDLDNIYQSSKSNEEKTALQKEILANAETKFKKLPMDASFKNIAWSKINNAYLLAFKTYNQDESIFSELLKHVNGDFARFFAELSKHSEGKDPFLALKEYLKEL